MMGEGPFRKGDDDTDDQKIIELYINRSEQALSETAGKYGRYCNAIAYGILKSHEDAQECVSDVYLTAWNAIPPRRPADLVAVEVPRCGKQPGLALALGERID